MMIVLRTPLIYEPQEKYAKSWYQLIRAVIIITVCMFQRWFGECLPNLRWCSKQNCHCLQNRFPIERTGVLNVGIVSMVANSRKTTSLCMRCNRQSRSISTMNNPRGGTVVEKPNHNCRESRNRLTAIFDSFEAFGFYWEWQYNFEGNFLLFFLMGCGYELQNLCLDKTIALSMKSYIIVRCHRSTCNPLLVQSDNLHAVYSTS